MKILAQLWSKCGIKERWHTPQDCMQEEKPCDDWTPSGCWIKAGILRDRYLRPDIQRNFCLIQNAVYDYWDGKKIKYNAGDERPGETYDEDVQRILQGERAEMAGAFAPHEAEEEKENSEDQGEESTSTTTSNDAITSYRLRSLIKGFSGWSSSKFRKKNSAVLMGLMGVWGLVRPSVFAFCCKRFAFDRCCTTTNHFKSSPSHLEARKGIEYNSSLTLMGKKTAVVRLLFCSVPLNISL